MATEKAFIVKLETGEELGPFDQEALLKQAENGAIPANAQVRSTLLPLWQKAQEVDFLKKIYRGQLQQMAAEKANTPWNQFKAQISRRGDFDPMAVQLSQEGITYSNAGFLFRFLAGVLDFLIVAAITVVLLLACWGLFRAGILPAPLAFNLALCLSWFGAAAYYMFTLRTYSQTYGQRFWGLALVTRNKMPVYPLRALCFFLLLVPFGIISPITYLLTGCRGSFQEVFTGTGVKRVFIARR